MFCAIAPSSKSTPATGTRPGTWSSTQLRFADSLRWIPAPWTQYLRQIRIARTCRTMQDLCETAPPDRERYRALEDLLKQLDDVKPFIRALDAERLLIGERFFSLSRDELSKVFWKQMGGGGGDALPLPVVKVVHRLAFNFLAFKPRLVADHAAYLRLMGKRVQLLQGPYRDRQEAEQFLDLSHWNALASLLGHSGGYERRDYSGFAATLRMTRAGLALLQYQQAHGAFPETLDALGLEGLIDPYAEEPLHYRPEGQGFVVYSVGEDRKDNDGTPRAGEAKTRTRVPSPGVRRGLAFPESEEQATGERQLRSGICEIGQAQEKASGRRGVWEFYGRTSGTQVESWRAAPAWRPSWS